MFVRFIIGEKDPDSGVAQGIFRTAGDLRRRVDTPAWQAAELERLLGWFGTNLEVPDRLNRTKSKGHYHRNGMAISWFKPNATEHILKIRDIVAILEEHDYVVRMITTRRPGYVVYEDEFQVAAVPFNSTRKGYLSKT